MYSEEWLVNYRGFSPSDLMGQLVDEAPYGSSLRASFSRHGGELKGRIEAYQTNPQASSEMERDPVQKAGETKTGGKS